MAWVHVTRNHVQDVVGKIRNNQIFTTRCLGEQIYIW